MSASLGARPSGLVLWDVPPGTGYRSRSRRPGAILNAIVRAKRTAALFGADHPVVAETMGEAHDVIVHLLASRQSVRFAIYEDAFFLENTVLLEESLQLYPLLLELREREIGVIELHQNVNRAELSSLVEVLNLDPPEIRRQGGAGAHLEKRGVRHITLGSAGPPREHLNIKIDPREAYRVGLRVVDELSFQASRDLPLDLRKARLVLNSLIDIVTKDRMALLGVAALKNYDEDTVHHSVNVSILSLLMGQQFALHRIAMTTLGLAALLHDMGKVRIPREILTKAGKLTPAEQEVMRRHTTYGAHMLRNLPGLARLAMVVAFEHHANYDLSGYPPVTVKHQPHLFTRIVQLADFFDAATSSRRVYHRAMLPHEAMRFILARAGKVFDPVVAKVFVQTLGLYPVGSVVELDTGDLAVVAGAAERDVTRPLVKVVRTRSGDAIVPYTLRLEEERGRCITRALDPVDAGVNTTLFLDGPEGEPG